MRATPSILPLAVSADVGDMVTLTCQLSLSSPPSTVSWWRDTTPLTNSSRISIDTGFQPSEIYEGLYDSASTLTILRSLTSDSGSYTCAASQQIMGLDEPLVTMAEQAADVQVAGRLLNHSVSKLQVTL